MKIQLLNMASILLTSILFLSACKNSPEEKAKKLIKDNLFETLHDYKSYEPVKFGKLDSSFSKMEDDENYSYAAAIYDSCKKESKDLSEKIDIYMPISVYSSTTKVRSLIAEHEQLLEYWRPYAHYIDSFSTGFKSKFNGWKMTHKFRSKALNGNSKLSMTVYYFDLPVSKVVNSKEIE